MNCKSIQKLNLSNFNTSRLKFLTETFKGCESLTSIALPNFNFSKLKGVSEIFNGCKNLKHSFLN